MLTLKKVFLVIVLLSSLQGFGQFEVSGVIRPRFEFRNGYSTLRDSVVEAAIFVTQRTRLNFKYTNEDIKVGISFYDFRIWGDQVLKSDASFVGLHQGWVELGLTGSISMKVGRQSLSYDNNRLMSPVNWNQVGAAHDMLLFKYRNNGWVVDLGSAYNQSEVNKFGTDYSALLANYRLLNILWVNRQFGKFDMAFQGFYDGYQKEGTTSTIYMRYTGGLIMKYKNSKTFLNVRGFYQGGSLQTGEDVSAWYMNLEGGADVNPKVQLIGGLEIKSGNDATDSLRTSDHAFDILYGARHKFNGVMDYFSVPVTSKGAGLINPYFRVKLNVSEKVNLFATYHYFQLYGNYIDQGELIDPYLGSELDLKFKIKFNSYLKLEGAYAFMLPTQSMTAIKGGDLDHFNSWAYVMLTVDPVFFKTK